MKANINWFPELLPQEQLIIDSWVEKSKKTYKNYWYVPLETSVVEDMKVLLAKGSDDKEIYGLKRFSDVWEKNESKMWLHFDLTIPFARYVINNFNDLTFPFKRYQIQKCWRWERPQLWRYREFLQSDIDVVWNWELPLHFDAEVLEIAIKTLNEIIPNKFEIFFNNRKIFDWLCDYYWIDEISKKSLVKTIDKVDKVWKEACMQELNELWIPKELADFLLVNEWIDLDINNIRNYFSPYLSNPIIINAINEIESLVNNLVDPSIISVVKFKVNLARWLDYYTWSIFEWRLLDFPSLSICWWWRYENLTNTIWNKKLPWVWISLWLTRIFWILDHLWQIHYNKPNNTDVIIWGFSGLQRKVANEIANLLRENDIDTEIYHDFEHKPTKQIKYATGKWINKIVFIWDNDELKLKDLVLWVQTDIDIDWLIDYFKNKN